MILLAIISIFLITLLTGVPVVFSIILASGVPILFDPNISLGQMSSIILQQIRSFTLLAIPLYIYCGKLLSLGGVADDLVYISKALIGKIRGDLAYVNIVASIFFAGISGSSVADAASLGAVLIPAMKKRGYSAEFSATLTAASATIGSIIPPSILFIVYGAIAQTSIAALFIGGIIPGMIIGLAQAGYSYYYAVKNNIGYEEDNNIIKDKQEVNLKTALIKSIFPASIFLIIIGGILLGIFTPTEAAGVAVIYTLFVLTIFYKKRDFTEYLEVTKEAVISSATIFIMIACASFLSWVLTYYQVMLPVVSFVQNSSLNATGFLLILMVIYVILGTFMEPNSAMLIFVPLMAPIVSLLHINPTVLGVITVMSIRLGTVTPPYGLSTLVVSKIAETNVMKMMKEIVIFCIFYVIVIIALIFCQSLITFLPNLFF